MKSLKAMSAALSAAALVATTTAGAQSPAADVESAQPQPDLAVTVSPVHLAFPMLELTVEHRLEDSVGVAAMAGYGKVSTDDDLTFNVYEAGFSGRYYVFGSFRHGMQVGGGVEYVHVSGDNLADRGISGIGTGVAVGPFLGYKYTSDAGFTFDSQLGAQFVTFGAEATDTDSGETDSGSESDVIPQLNLNIGWSF